MPSQRPAAWSAVLRSALLFTPILIVSLIILTYLIIDAVNDGLSAGRTFALSLAGFVALLLGYQSLTSIRDLFSRPVDTTGVVERRWSRSDLFIFQNVYIFVERRVFRLEPEQALEIDVGDTVRVTHFPHTGTVESIEVVQRAEPAAVKAHV